MSIDVSALQHYSTQWCVWFCLMSQTQGYVSNDKCGVCGVVLCLDIMSRPNDASTVVVYVVLWYCIVTRSVLPPCAVDGRCRNPLYYYYYYYYY